MPDQVAENISIERRLEVETPEAVAFSYPLAGLGSRGVAAMLDVMMLGLLLLAEFVVGVVAILLVERVSGRAVNVFTYWALAALIIVVFVTYWGYYIFGEVFRNGRTFGKRVVRIRVVREDGSRVGVLESVIRNVVRIADLLPGTYGFGIVSILASGKAQRLGDMAAGTVVIEEPPNLFDLDIDANGELASLARDYLTRRVGLTPEARWQVGVSLLAAFGEQPQPGWDEPVVAGRVADLAGARDVA